MTGRPYRADPLALISVCIETGPIVGRKWRVRVGSLSADDEIAGKDQVGGASVITAVRSDGRSFQ